MQTLRTTPYIARLVLVWFALFVGASVAAPWVNPSEVQLVCSASGNMLLVSSSDDGTELQTTSGMDCPLCASTLSLPLHQHVAGDKPIAQAHSRVPLVVHDVAMGSAPPLPSRGPPTFSF